MDDIVGGPIFSSFDQSSGLVVKHMRELVERIRVEGAAKFVSELIEASNANVSLEALRQIDDETVIKLINDAISTAEFAPDKNILVASLSGESLLAVCINTSPTNEVDNIFTTEFKELTIPIPQGAPEAIRAAVIKVTLELLAEGKNCAIAWKVCEFFCNADFSLTEDIKVEVVKLNL